MGLQLIAHDGGSPCSPLLCQEPDQGRGPLKRRGNPLSPEQVRECQPPSAHSPLVTGWWGGEGAAGGASHHRHPTAHPAPGSNDLSLMSFAGEEDMLKLADEIQEVLNTSLEKNEPDNDVYSSSLF